MLLDSAPLTSKDINRPWRWHEDIGIWAESDGRWPSAMEDEELKNMPSGHYFADLNRQSDDSEAVRQAMRQWDNMTKRQGDRFRLTNNIRIYVLMSFDIPLSISEQISFQLLTWVITSRLLTQSHSGTQVCSRYKNKTWWRARTYWVVKSSD